MPVTFDGDIPANELAGNGHARKGFGSMKRGYTAKGAIRKHYPSTWPLVRAHMESEGRGDAWNDDKANSFGQIQAYLRTQNNITNNELRAAIGAQAVPIGDHVQACAIIAADTALELANAQLAADQPALLAAYGRVRDAVEASEDPARLARAFDAVDDAFGNQAEPAAREDYDFFESLHEEDETSPEWLLMWPQARNAGWNKALALAGVGVAGVDTADLTLLSAVWDSVVV